MHITIKRGRMVGGAQQRCLLDHQDLGHFTFTSKPGCTCTLIAIVWATLRILAAHDHIRPLSKGLAEFTHGFYL
jgi:hypothetical protein